MNMRIVVTGAAGFLGRAIVASALAEPKILQVVACDLAPLDLIAGCTRGTRIVFASSLAVLGDSPNARAPMMIYGAHKAMAEIAVETATRRGEIDGISLRPGGIVARKGDGAGLKSAFLSRLFWAVREGTDISLPVSPDGTTWLASVGNVAANFMQAALMPDLGPHRSLTLPMLDVQFGDLVTALQAALPDSPSQINYAQKNNIMSLFGHAQPLVFEHSLAAGLRPDGDLASLIQNALKHEDLQ